MSLALLSITTISNATQVAPSLFLINSKSLILKFLINNFFDLITS